MIAVISSGARIAADRSAGWTRQMRITPLSAGNYFGAKVLCGFLMAILSIALLSLSGTALGVRLSAGGWLTVIGLMLVGLIPFDGARDPARTPAHRGLPGPRGGRGHDAARASWAALTGS